MIDRCSSTFCHESQTSTERKVLNFVIVSRAARTLLVPFGGGGKAYWVASPLFVKQLLLPVCTLGLRQTGRFQNSPSTWQLAPSKEFASR